MGGGIHGLGCKRIDMEMGKEGRGKGLKSVRRGG